METPEQQPAQDQSGRINPPPPPIPPKIENATPDQQPDKNNGNDSQSKQAEPIKIVIVDDNRTKDKTGFWANWIAFGNLVLAVIILIITALLFKETQKTTRDATRSADASVRSAEVAEKTLSDQRKADSSQRISDRAKDSTDSIKYVRDTIAENKKDANNIANQQRLFNIQQASTQAQIDALNETKNQFKEINKPILQISAVKIDTLMPGHVFKIYGSLSNFGNYPVKVLSMYTERVFRYNTPTFTDTLNNKILNVIGAVNQVITTTTPYDFIVNDVEYLKLDYFNAIYYADMPFYFMGTVRYLNLITNDTGAYRFMVKTWPLTNKYLYLINENY